nr:uncharacterized protein LOC121124624 isoform X2 [Lepeophtheirus salmonis]
MGPFMVEIVFCRVTRRGRKLKKGMNKAGLSNMRNDGPSTTFIPADDTVKITLDLSENGPVFNALDEMMMKMLEDDASDRKKPKKSGGGAGGGEAKKALKSLLKSGIPGIEKMFAPAGKGKKGSAKGFHKMNEGSKKKFMKAIFGEDGTAIETGTAAALIAATCSGGDPEVGDKIAQLLVPELGDKIDPAMMAALMVACSMISAGAGMEEVLKAMKAELLDSGMSEEDIFRKTQLLMQAFGRDESGSLAEYSLVGKQKNSALKKIELSPKDFAQIVLLQRTIAASGATPENIAKVIMIENQLSKRGAQHRHIADALKKLIDPNKGRKDTIEKLSKAITDVKMKKEDVQASVRVMQALEMENEPTWKEVKSMKDILQGASPNSPEAIELNLARATKAAGINRGEFTKILVAQKAMSVLGIDAKHLAQVMNIEKVIADNGVPAVEIARVLSDGGVPVDAHKKLAEITAAGLEKDFCAADVDSFVNLYDNFKLKSNIPDETIEHIDKTLIQVRCSLEDVADNLICSMNARGEKEHVIIRNLCETLKDTGASVQIVGTTMMGSLGKALPKTEPELMKDTGRSLTEVGYCTEDVNSTMTEILLNVLDEKPEMREDAVRACEVVMKDSGQFPDQIRKHLDAVLPPEEKKMDPRLAEELERLRAAEEAREARGEGGHDDSGSEIEYDESNRPIPKINGTPLVLIIEPKNMAKAMKDRTGSRVSSRRGSSIGTTPRGSISIGGTERRGSFYSDDVSKRNSVAIVVDDPDNKINMEKALNEVFNNESKDEGDSGIDSIQATQILNLLNQAVTSDASTSSKPEQNLMEIEKILGSQNVTGLSSKVNQGQLSKVLNAVSGPDIKSTFTSRQQHQQSNQAVTDGSALLIGKGQTTNNKQETIQDILNLQQSGNNLSSQLELIQQLTSLGTILKEPSEEVANIIYSKGLSSLKDPEQAQEIVKGILSQRGVSALGSKPDEVLQMAKILSNEAQTDRTGSLLAQKEKDTSMFSQIDDTILSQDIVEALAQSGDSNLNEKSRMIHNFLVQKGVTPNQLDKVEASMSFTGIITTNYNKCLILSTLNPLGNNDSLTSDKSQKLANVLSLKGAADDESHGDGLEEDCDYLDIDPETVDEVVSAFEQSGLSEAEIKKLIGVFKIDGKIHHIGGVSKFRTSENIKNTILDTEDMFDKALDSVEAQKAALKKVGVSSETRKLMKKIMDKQNATAEVTNRVATLLASSELCSTKGTNYKKRDEIERVEYTPIKDINVRRSTRRFDVPDIETEETYRHPASLGIGVIGTGNQHLVRRNVQRRVSRYRALEESRESSIDEDRRITGLRRAKVPLMVYSCGGFTRCYRIARFHTVDGPPIGLKYRENPTSGL